MMFKRFLFVLCLFVGLFVLGCSVSAADDFPVYVGDVGFPTIQDALSVAGSNPVHVVSDLHLTSDLHLDHNVLYIDSGVTVFCDRYYIGVGAQSDFYLFGNLVCNSSMSRIVVGASSNLYIYGNVNCTNSGFLNVYSRCHVEFNGCSIMCDRYCVTVENNALTSDLIVNGALFYSSSESVPLYPLDAFSFPDGVDVIYQKGQNYAEQQ